MNFIEKTFKTLKEEDHRRALYATMIFSMLLTLMFLLVSMAEPDPPVEEILIPIDMENIEIPEEVIEELTDPGGGGSQGLSSSVINPTPSPTITPTQDDPSGVSEPAVQNDHVDDGLTFGGQQGTGAGNGDGDVFGDGDGVNQGDGSGDGKYNPSRKVTIAPTFTGKAQEEGKIALDIYVDENGKVDHVRYKESKSTSGSAYLIKLATAAAKTMKYDKKPGAGIEHVGYEVFEFRKV